MENKLLSFNRREISSLIKGLRYSLGYSLPDMGKVELAKGLVGNWEYGFCLPNKRNLEILENLIIKSGKSYQELIEIGKLNFGILIENMAKKLRISEQILLRFVISHYIHISDINKLNKLREGKIDLAPKTKLTLLQLNERIQNNNKDTRKMIFKLQKEVTFSNVDNLKVLILVNEYLKTQKRLISETKLNYGDGFSSDWLHNRADIPNKVLSKIQSTYPNLLIKIEEQIKNDDSIIHKQWKRAENYAEVIGFQYRNEQFENEIFNLFEPICGDLIKNALIASKDFSYITEIDLIGTYKGKKIYFMCKDVKLQKLINKRRITEKEISLIKQHFKPDVILLVISSDYTNGNHFKEGGLFLINKRDIPRIKEDPNYLLEILNRKEQKEDLNYELERFRVNNKLSKLQLFSLLECSTFVRRYIKNRQELPKWLNEKFNLINKINNIRKLHFLANKKFALKGNDYMFLRYIRNQLGISIKDISSQLNINEEYIGNLEKGRKTSKIIKKKYYDYLKTLDNFSKTERKSKEYVDDYFNMWNKAEKFEKIINFRSNPPRGDALEKEIETKLKSKGWLVFRNVVLANNNLTFKREIDIYAIKDGKELIIECTTTRTAFKWDSVAEVLKDIKEKLECDVIFVSTKISDFGKKVLKTRGVSGVNINEL